MTLIEGIGDEVTHFFLVLIVILVGLIAWWSTRIADQPLIRTVLILERRTRHRVAAEPASPPSTASTSLENSIDTGQLEAAEPGSDSQQEAGAACQICDKESTNIPATCSSSALNNGQNPEASSPTVGESNGSRENLRPTSTLRPRRRRLEFPDSRNRTNIALLNDPEATVLRNRRLAFFQSRHVTLVNSSSTGETARSAPNSSPSSEPTDTVNETDGNTGISTDSNDEVPSGGSIRIRLKYLNDDQKLVEGNLQEQLGDFKRRHFSLELSADKLVRLIFNGQVLQSDSETLEGYGLFDNCVVHCLVHQQISRSTNQGSSTGSQTARDSASNSGLGNAGAAGLRDWDLGNVLFASLSILLGLAWYCRYQYAQLFNATTTVALVGLTGILTVSLVGIYLPDQDGLRH